jgi:hypothetical protein
VSGIGGHSGSDITTLIMLAFDPDQAFVEFQSRENFEQRQFMFSKTFLSEVTN